MKNINFKESILITGGSELKKDISIEKLKNKDIKITPKGRNKRIEYQDNSSNTKFEVLAAINYFMGFGLFCSGLILGGACCNKIKDMYNGKSIRSEIGDFFIALIMSAGLTSLGIWALSGVFENNNKRHKDY